MTQPNKRTNKTGAGDSRAKEEVQKATSKDELAMPTVNPSAYSSEESAAPTKVNRGADIYLRIEQLIEQQGITKAEFARTIRVSTGNIGDWKRGKSIPGAGVLIDIARTYGTSLDWLLLGKPEKQRLLREERDVYFFADKWQLDSRFGELSLEEQAFVREYIVFCSERKRTAFRRRDPE